MHQIHHAGALTDPARSTPAQAVSLHVHTSSPSKPLLHSYNTCLLFPTDTNGGGCFLSQHAQPRPQHNHRLAAAIVFTQKKTKRALRATTPGWRDAENDETRRDEMTAGFTMRALTGGMTNAVFRCSKPGGDNQTVLLRSYGKGTEVSLNL